MTDTYQSHEHEVGSVGAAASMRHPRIIGLFGSREPDGFGPAVPPTLPDPSMLSPRWFNGWGYTAMHYIALCCNYGALPSVIQEPLEMGLRRLISAIGVGKRL